MGKGDGKGKGRGGCGALEAAGDCVQCIATTICLICIAGPICIIIGIAFISSAFENDRAERIDEFKVAVGNWMDGAVGGFADSQADWSYSVVNSCGANVPETPLSLSNAPEELGAESGESDFIGYQTVVLEDTTPSITTTQQTGVTCNLVISILFQDTVIANVTEPAITEVNYGFDQICQRTTSTSSSNSGRRQDFTNQDINQCESVCRSRGGTPAGNTYNNFECRVQESPSGVCVRVSKSGETWQEATGTLPERTEGARGAGCFLPISFSALTSGGNWETVQREPVQGNGALTFPVEIRSERDPYLYFLDISRGTKDFGLTTGEKLRIGFSLLAIGILLTTCVCCCCCAIVKFARQIATGKTSRPENPVGGAMYDVAGKYGNYIPGGAALGHPAPGQTMQGVPAGKPPAGYPNAGGAGYGGQQPYNGNTSYDSPNVQYGVNGGGYAGGATNTNTAPWAGGNTANQYGGAPSYATGQNAGAAPPGYPTAV